MMSTRVVVAMHTGPRTIFFLVHFFLLASVLMLSTGAFLLFDFLFRMFNDFFFSFLGRTVRRIAYRRASRKKSNYEDLHNRTQHKLRIDETEHEMESKMENANAMAKQKKYIYVYQFVKLSNTLYTIVNVMFENTSKNGAAEKKQIRLKILLWQMTVILD